MKIKKILLTLWLLWIWLVNITFGYTVNNNCFTHPTNNQIYYTCIDLELWENYNIYTTNWIENTVNNWFSFISSWWNNYLIWKYYNWNNVYTISFFNEQWYFNTFNSWYDINDNNINNTRARYYSWLHYCWIEDTTQETNFSNCIWNYYLNSNTNLISYTHSIEDTLEFIDNSNIKSWKIIYEYEEIPYILCWIFNNNKWVCVIPLWNWNRNTDSNYCSTDSCLYSWVSLERIWNLTLNDILNNLDDYWISQSPFYSNWWNNEENIETTTWWQRLCPPIKNDITMYGRNYTTSLCWSDWTTNSWWEIINTWYVSILTAYPTYQDYLNGYNTYTTYCNQESPRYDYTECKNQLQALPYWKAWAKIVRNGIKSNLPTQKIYQYCYLQLNFTEDEKRDKSRCNTTEDEYFAPWITWDLRQESWGNPVEWLSDMIEYSDEWFISPNDWSIFDDILPDWILSRKSIINIDFIGNISKLIAKILILFKTRPVVDWILPPVILSLLLLIILFKMYKK